MTKSSDAERRISELEEHIARLQAMADEGGLDVTSEIETLGTKLERLRMDAFKNLSAMERVQLARHPKRLFTLDYVERVFTDFIELHGDRAFRDDAAIVGGWARLDGEPLMVIGQQKGRDMKDNLRRNFGMPHPEGYRKALRLMQLADKFGRPVVTLIDTPGAWPGIGAEERGQAEAIARNLREMARFRVPLVSVVIGEGGSGGALALGVTDRILMLENATYSVITPEGCAAILWKSEDARDKAAAALRLTARDLEELGVVDEVIPEPSGGAHNDWDSTAAAVHAALSRHLGELKQRAPDQLRQERWAKYDAMGAWRADATSSLS
ncbi:MAG TPA: acetyl-CoA carboxylase carboxyltransferase subunit alpha [Longimicrobiales bacterium]|nr:acetyl-CoA carboxylase carboxyltransferase subunit alpha [Longimicrobiales bacterium]